MDNFLHRLKISLVGEAGLIVYGLASLAGTAFLFAVSPVLRRRNICRLAIHEMGQGPGRLLYQFALLMTQKGDRMPCVVK